MNKCFIFVNPEDHVTSAGGEAGHGHVASEITSPERQAFPLSHTAELNTQHRLDVDCLCASGFW